MSGLAHSFLDEIDKIAAAATPKVTMPPSPLEMQNKMMQDQIDNVNLTVQMDQAQQAQQTIEQQKQMQMQQEQEQAMKQQQEAQQQQAMAQQGQQPQELPGNPQDAVVAEGQ